MSSFDAIVIGAGHNGLTAASLLARTGYKVLVLEARDHVGGLAVGSEFHPGYRGTGPLHDTTCVRAEIVRELELEQRGLRMRTQRPDVLAIADDGSQLVIPGDPGQAAEQIGRGSADDADAYVRYHAFIDSIRPLLSRWMDRPPIDLVHLDRQSLVALGMRGMDLRRLGRKEMLDFMRLPPMAVRDWLDEWFDSELLKTALAVPALSGTFCGPRSPGTTANLLLYEAASSVGVQGGAPMLIDALQRRARRLGVEIRTSTEVQEILLDGDAVRGVKLADGEEFLASRVAASCDPRRTLLSLLPAGHMDLRFEQRIGSYRSRGTTAQVLLALNERIRFAGDASERRIETVRIGSNLVDFERAFDAIKYRQFSEKPILEIHIPTVGAPQLAPEGHDVVSMLVHFAPHALEGGWNDDARERLGDVAAAILEEHAPGTGAATVGRKVLTPADIEREFGVSGGNIHHGEHALDQYLVRPTPECIHYSTPFDGLYLCGSGTHPGGGLTCAPGALAAGAMLKG